jgi:hypothetical protein
VCVDRACAFAFVCLQVEVRESGPPEILSTVAPRELAEVCFIVEETSEEEEEEAGSSDDETTGALHSAAMSKLRGVKKVRHIAGGVFSEVWQGEWEGVPVAIKVAKGASPRAVEALLREVEVAMSIKLHPNLVAVYGVCDGADGELQLVLEYCEDGALLDWLRRLDKVCAARERPGKAFRAVFRRLVG